MITKDDGLRYAKLIHVSVDNGKTDNSNKVYIMTEQSDGQIKCEYGRVGKSLATVFKPSSQWHKIINEKTGKSKGYTDVTELIVEAMADAKADPNDKAKTAEIENIVVKRLIDELMAYANKSIQKNYKVTQDDVTEMQVQSAQEALTLATTKLKVGGDVKEVNDLLLRLYTVIPRRMDNVKLYLIESLKTQADFDKASKFLGEEQDTLDTMAGQVKLIKQQREQAAVEETDEAVQQTVTILDQMGLVIEEELDPKVLAHIHKLLGPNSKQGKKIYKAINKSTQKAFDSHLDKAKDKTTELLWHGSRNENWFNIMQTGLMIRPSGAIHTGSMFGDGIYFANKAQKSIGYSSLSGSYWTRGGSDKGFLALFNVHLGNQKHIHRHDSNCYSLCENVIRKDGYDCVYAHGGADLRNDEFIVYNRNQCTLAYLVEIAN